MSEALREGYERHIAAGHHVPDLSASSRLEAFEAVRMAEALEREVNRAQQTPGMQKIQVSLTFDDASRLAAFMRRASLAGA